MSSIMNNANESITPETELDDEVPDDPFEGDGGGDNLCDWDEDGQPCDETATGTLMELCGNPNCKYSHTYSYCPTHYAVSLNMRLDAIRDSDFMMKSDSPDEIAEAFNGSMLTASHIPMSDLEKRRNHTITDDDISKSAGSFKNLSMVPYGHSEFVLKDCSKKSLKEFNDWVSSLNALGAGLDLTVARIRRTKYVVKGKEKLSDVLLYIFGHDMTESDFEGKKQGIWRVSPYYSIWIPEIAGAQQMALDLQPRIYVLSNSVGEESRLSIDDSITLDQVEKTGWLLDGGKWAEASQAAVFLIDKEHGWAIPVTCRSFILWMRDGDMESLHVESNVNHNRRWAPYEHLLKTHDPVEAEELAIQGEKRFHDYSNGIKEPSTRAKTSEEMSTFINGMITDTLDKCWSERNIEDYFI